MDDLAGKMMAAMLAAVVGGGITAICSVAAIRVYIKWLFADMELLRTDVRSLIDRVTALEGGRRRSDGK